MWEDMSVAMLSEHEDEAPAFILSHLSLSLSLLYMYVNGMSGLCVHGIHMNSCECYIILYLNCV